MIKVNYKCPDCGGSFSTNVDINDIDEIVNNTITCLCDRDIIIEDYKINDSGEIWLNCGHINYGYYIVVNK